MPPGTSSVRINFASVIRCQICLLHPRWPPYRSATLRFMCRRVLRLSASTACLWVAAVSLCHVMLHMPPGTSSVRINFASVIRCQICLLHPGWPPYRSATLHFMCRQVLRLSASTSCLWVAAVSLCHTICKATSNVNYMSY